MTLEERIAVTGGRSTGFDYMRIALALTIVIIHSVGSSYGKVALGLFAGSLLFRPVSAIILPMFFALSGFLVAGSLYRCRTLFMFFGLRILRILPALAVEAVLSALVLGPFFTTLPLRQYFTSHLFLVYLLNIVGDVHFYLPGVFEHNPWPNIVNSQLWTIPWELCCYITLGVLALLGLSHKRAWFICAPFAAIVAHFTWVAVKHPHGLIDNEGARLMGPQLVISYLFGAGIYMYRDKLRWDSRLFYLTLAFSLLALGTNTKAGDYIALPTVGYVTAYLGLHNPPKTQLLRGSDYSYGVYLYGMVIEQAVAAVGVKVWYVNAFVSIAVALCLAALSWRFVEEPALSLRSRVKALENRWIDARRKLLPVNFPLLSEVDAPNHGLYGLLLSRWVSLTTSSSRAPLR